ncbi:Short chain dehydrogenase virG [Paramyrothecium foliicola]|nr:Short chain dehydrogenase virG [Paramyrothecium foliicola]
MDALPTVTSAPGSGLPGIDIAPVFLFDVARTTSISASLVEATLKGHERWRTYLVTIPDLPVQTVTHMLEYGGSRFSMSWGGEHTVAGERTSWGINDIDANEIGTVGLDKRAWYHETSVAVGEEIGPASSTAVDLCFSLQRMGFMDVTAGAEKNHELTASYDELTSSNHELLGSDSRTIAVEDLYASRDELLSVAKCTASQTSLVPVSRPTANSTEERVTASSTGGVTETAGADNDGSAEVRATQLAFLNRQFFRSTPAVTRAEVDLAGQTAIVTGSNVGLGLECSRQLLSLGIGKLILAVRSVAKGEAARAQLAAETSSRGQSIEVWKLDLSEYDSILEFVERTNTLDRLDIFVHNAGIVNKNFELNPKTGHEQMLQTNYLSSALLIMLMLPILKEKKSSDKPGRLALVSSETAAWATFQERAPEPILANFDREDLFESNDRYWTSKLLGHLFLTELARRIPSSAVVINAPNPGLCYGSNLMNDYNGSIYGLILSVMIRLVGRSAEMGARALTDAVVRHGPESHGQYLEDGRLQPMAPLVYTSKGAELAKQLWAETMSELSFAGVADIVQRLSD